MLKCFSDIDFVLGSKAVDFLRCEVSGEKVLLLESENLYMKLKIQQLEFELESERIRSRHFEGLAEIAMLELKRGNWVNSNGRGKKFCKAFSDVKGVKVELSNCVQKLEEIMSSVEDCV